MLREEQPQERRPQSQDRLDRPRGKADWKTVVVYVDKESTLAVEVRQDVACPWPKYSFRLGCLRENDAAVQSFIQARIVNRDGTLIERIPSLIFPRLLAQAEAYVIEQRASYEAEQQVFQAQREAQREARRATRPGGSKGKSPSVMRKGKTARDRENKKARRGS
jgi:hypothetical protein